MQEKDDQFKALCFFTEYMQAAMAAWPEFICIDATYNLFFLNYILILIIVMDGNGESEVVGVCISRDETAPTYEWFLNLLGFIY